MSALKEPRWVMIDFDGEMSLVACCPDCWCKMIDEDGTAMVRTTNLEPVGEHEWSCPKCEEALVE